MVTLAIIFLLITHLIGVPVMIWAVRGEQGMKGLLDWLPSSDEESDGGDGGSKVPQAPRPVRPTGGAPLPESEPSRMRLREHGDRLANPDRRPHRAPRPSTPAPQRVPERSRTH